MCIVNIRRQTKLNNYAIKLSRKNIKMVSKSKERFGGKKGGYV